MSGQGEGDLFSLNVNWRTWCRKGDRVAPSRIGKKEGAVKRPPLKAGRNEKFFEKGGGNYHTFRRTTKDN